MTIFEIFKIVSIFILFFFSAFLFSYKSGNKKSNIILATIISFQAMELLNGSFYGSFNFWVKNYPWLFYTTEFTFFLWGPALYFFFIISTDSTFFFKKKQLLHLVPAIIHTSILIVSFHILSIPEKQKIMHVGLFSSMEDTIIHALRNISVVVYLFLSFKIFNKYNKSIKSKNHVNIQNSIEWLRFLLIFFSLFELIQFIQFINIETRIHHLIIYYITTPLSFILGVLILFKAFRTPFIFQYVPEEYKAEIRSEVDDDELKDLVLKIEACMLNEKLYLTPDLQLKDMAEKLCVTSKKISQVINLYFEKNFSDYVNEFRIQDAKKLLLDGRSENLTILAIAFEAGFNSKSTFNRVFQKETGTTPSEFKKQNREM